MRLKYLKPAILSLSLLTILMNAAIVPVLSQISQAFPQADPALIKLILSLPALTNILFSLVSGWLARFLPKRTILIAALILYILSGLGSSFALTIEMLLFGRALLGAGTGLISPLITDLIAYFFKGEERIRMIGYSNASSNFSGIFLPLLAGWLAGFNWQYAFWVYGIAILVLLCVFFFIPITPVNQNSKITRAAAFAQKPTIMVALTNFFVVLVFYSLPANLSIFVREENIGTTSIAALAISVSTLTSTLIGMAFSRLYHWFHHRLLAIGLLFCAMGFITLTFFSGIYVLMFAEILVGVGIGVLFPYFSLRVTQVSSSQNLTSGLSMLSASFGMGIFISTPFYLIINRLFHLNTIRGEFTISAVLFSLTGVFTLLFSKNSKENPKLS